MKNNKQDRSSTVTPFRRESRRDSFNPDRSVDESTHIDEQLEAME